MATDLGTLPITVTATALELDGTTPDTSAVLAFELSGAVDVDGTPIADPTTVATLADAGNGTCTVTEAAGAPQGASVKLDAVGTDPVGSKPVSSADSGDTLTFTVPVVVPPPPPATNISKISLAVTDNPNVAAPAASEPVAPAETAPAAPAAAEEPAAPTEPVTQGVDPNPPPQVNDAGWPTAS